MAKKNVNIKIKADSKDAEKGLNKVTGQINKLKKTLSSNQFSRLITSVNGLGTIAKGVTSAIKGTVEKLKDLADAANVQIKAERQLETAAKNNPYLNKSNVSQLKSFASQLQSISAVGDEQLLPLMAQLAAAGRTQTEIQDIMSASLDISASGTMSLESAVKNLNKTYAGLKGELGESIPQIKNLTTEQLKSGEAVKIVASQYKGLAEETTKATGGWQKFKNSYGDLKEILGDNVANAQNKLGNALSEFVDNIAEKMKIAKEEAQHFKDILTFENAKQNGITDVDNASAAVDALEKKVKELKEIQELVNQPQQSYQGFTGEIDEFGRLKNPLEQQYNDAQNKINDIQSKLKKLPTGLSDLNGIYANQRKELEGQLETQLKIQETVVEQNKAQLDLTSKQQDANAKLKNLYEGLIKKDKELKKQYKTDSAGVLNSLLSDDIATWEEQLKIAQDTLKIEQAKLQTKKEEQEIENKNNSAQDFKNQYEAKIAAYDKQAENQEKVNNALTQEEYLQGKIKVMQEGLIDLVEKSSGLITWNNWSVQNEYLPALIQAQEELKKLQDEKNTPTTDSEKNATTVDSIIEQWNNRVITAKEAISQINALLDEHKIKEQEHANAIGLIYKTQAQNITSEIVNYTSQLSEITSTISSLVSENAEAIASSQTSALTKQYEDGLISYEDYCDELEQIQKEQAMTEYKASMASWTLQVAQTTANIAQGVASCLKDGFPLGLINGALISAAGAAQLASVIASKPQKPSFATGGIVQGNSYTGDNVQANVNSGEMILNSKQQLALWKMANNGTSNSSFNQSVIVNNTASDKVNVNTQLSKEKLIITVKEIVNSEMAKGSFRNSMQISNAQNNGVKIL